MLQVRALNQFYGGSHTLWDVDLFVNTGSRTCLMDGYAVAGALRENVALADVPIVAVTSYAMVGDRERILAAGCNGYIEKPINPDTFVDELAAFL